MDDFNTLPKMASWSDKHGVTVPEEKMVLIGKTKPNYKFFFHGIDSTGWASGPAVGSLDFKGPEMKFEGNADESAKVFFDYVARYFQERLKEEYQRGYEAAKKEMT